MLNAHSHPVHIVVAVDTYGGYAKDGTIPWNIPEDMKRFQDITSGGICIMGRGTYEDMVKIQASKRKEGDLVPTQILPGRDSYVITSNPNYEAPGAQVGSGITNIIDTLEDGDERNVFILGGHRLFVEALGRPCAVHMAIIKGDPFICDLTFPIEALNTHYEIVGGNETELCYNVLYQPKPRRMTEHEQWEQFISENFRPA